MNYVVNKTGKFQVRFAEGNQCGLAGMHSFSFDFTVQTYKLDDRQFVVEHFGVEDAIKAHFGNKRNTFRGSCEQLAVAVGALIVEHIQPDKRKHASVKVKLQGGTKASITVDGTGLQFLNPTAPRLEQVSGQPYVYAPANTAADAVAQDEETTQPTPQPATLPRPMVGAVYLRTHGSSRLHYRLGRDGRPEVKDSQHPDSEWSPSSDYKTNDSFVNAIATNSLGEFTLATAGVSVEQQVLAGNIFARRKGTLDHLLYYRNDHGTIRYTSPTSDNVASADYRTVGAFIEAIKAEPERFKLIGTTMPANPFGTPLESPDEDEDEELETTERRLC